MYKCILTNELVSLKYLVVCLVHTRMQSILIKYTHEKCGISSEHNTEKGLTWYEGVQRGRKDVGKKDVRCTDTRKDNNYDGTRKEVERKTEH